MKRICPVCKSEVRTCSGPRKNKHGDSHLYVYCSTCEKKYHVYLDQYGNVDRIVNRYDHAPKNYQAAVAEMKQVCPPTSLKAHIQSVVDGTYQEPKTIKLNLKQKPKEKDGVIIKLDPNEDYTKDLEDNLRKIMQRL